MAKGKSSVGFWLLIGTLVVGGGVGIYFLLREPKDETTDDNLDEKKDDTNIPIIKDDSGSGGGSQGKPKSSAPSELNTADKIKAFQNYVLNVKNDVSILGGSGVDGKWGTNSQKAWDKYGTGFKQSPTFKGFATVVSQDAKERIIAFAKGSDKATSKFLNNANQDFVKKWAETIGKDKTAFIWAEQVYRTKTGERVMDYNPLKFNLKTSKVATLRASASKDSAGTGIKAGEELGKGGDIKFNNQLYIYLPNKKKWIASINVKKASSSFTGGEEEIWAGFDNNFDVSFR